MEMQRNKYQTLVLINRQQKKRSKTCEDNYIYLISQMCNQLNMIAHYNRYLFTKCCGMKEKSLIFAFKVYRNFSKNLKMKCTEV